MASWRVIRQDDNGTVFVVAEARTEDEARGLVAELEAMTHNQRYRVEPVPEAPPAPPAGGTPPPGPARKS